MANYNCHLLKQSKGAFSTRNNLNAPGRLTKLTVQETSRKTVGRSGRLNKLSVQDTSRKVLGKNGRLNLLSVDRTRSVRKYNGRLQELQPKLTDRNKFVQYQYPRVTPLDYSWTKNLTK